MHCVPLQGLGPAFCQVQVWERHPIWPMQLTLTWQEDVALFSLCLVSRKKNPHDFGLCMPEGLDLPYQVLNPSSHFTQVCQRSWYFQLHLPAELSHHAGGTCQGTWWSVRVCPICIFSSSGNQSLGLEGTGALTFDCALFPHGVRVRPWDPGMQRLAEFHSPDTARDTLLLQVLWEQAGGYSCSHWGKDWSMRSCFVSREPTCQRKHEEADVRLPLIQEELQLKLWFP